MSPAEPNTDRESPYCRENWWYDETVPDSEAETAAQPTDADWDVDPREPGMPHDVAPAALMKQEVARLTRPLCARSLDEDGEAIELSEPRFYLPKQHETDTHTVEYRQHAQPRRVNPDTGYIGGGETTAIGLPELDEETYIQAVHNVLARLGVLASNTDAWLTHARQLYHDPQSNSTKALELFIRHKREYDRGERSTVPH